MPQNDVSEWDSAYKRLVELRIAVVKDGKYVYSREFEESVSVFNKNPPGRIQSLKIARQIQKAIVPLLLQQAKIYKSRKEIELTAIAYMQLKAHCRRLKLDLPDEIISLVWAIYWLNGHEPSVDEEEE